jgi:hypothetical protein
VTILSRLPRQPYRHEVLPGEQASYDQVIDRMRSMLAPTDEREDGFFDAGEYYGALLNSPDMCAALTRLGTLVRGAGESDGTYSHADREFVDQVLSVEFDTTVVQATHVPDAISAGVRIEAIEALRRGDESGLTEDERLLAAYIRAVVHGTVTDEIWARMIDRLGTKGVVEYTVFITFLQQIIRLMQALDTSGPTQEDVDRMLEAYKADVPPDFRERLH